MNNYSFIGSTHLDNNYNISNLIFSTSNILETHLSNTSNTLEIHISNASNILEAHLSTASNLLETHASNYTNILRNDMNQMIKTKIDVNSSANTLFVDWNTTPLNQTYITNSNLGGQIRFWVSSTPLFPTQVIESTPDYRVIIDVDGKLKLYYSYNSSINLTWGSGWVDVIDVLIGILANNANTGVVIGGIQAEIISLTNKENEDIVGVYGAILALENGDLQYDFDTLMEFRDNVRTGTNFDNTEHYLYDAFANVRSVISIRNMTYLGSAMNSINLFVSRNPALAFTLGIGGTVFAAVYGISQTVSFNGFLQNLYKSVNSNTNLSQTDKDTLNTITQNELIAENIIDICSSIYQIGINQGFINSNITTSQTIPSLSTSSIYLNAGQITGVSTLNATTGIFGNLSTTNNTNIAIPSIGNYGGIGDKIIISNGTSTDYPCSIGIYNSNMWFSISSNYNYSWYIGGSNLLTLNSNTLNFSTGIINASNIQQGGQNIITLSQTNILNNTPNVVKKYGFNATCSTSIVMSDNNTYYKYDIDLRNYTSTKLSDATNSPYRIFNIKVYFRSLFFEYFTSSKPNILSYDVYMCNQLVAGTQGQQAGINIAAIGTPQNYLLNSILPITMSLLRTGNFNYLSVISRINNLAISIIIQDQLF